MEFVPSKRNQETVTLNKGQQKAVDNLIDFIASPFSKGSNVQALCGAGGVGKTFVMKYVIEHCRYTRSMIICAAPTHKACRVLANATKMKVDTIQNYLVFVLMLTLKTLTQIIQFSNLLVALSLMAILHEFL